MCKDNAIITWGHRDMQGTQPQKCFYLITDRSIISSKLYERTRRKLADGLIVWQYMPMPCHVMLLLRCHSCNPYKIISTIYWWFNCWLRKPLSMLSVKVKLLAATPISGCHSSQVYYYFSTSAFLLPVSDTERATGPTDCGAEGHNKGNHFRHLSRWRSRAHRWYVVVS